MSSPWVVFLIVIFLTASQANIISRRYTAKQELDNKTSNKEVYGEYTARSLSACSEVCKKNCTFFGYNGKLKTCRLHKNIFVSDMSDEAGWRYFSHHPLPQDCKDFLENGQINSGVFEIYPYGTVSSPVKVYCDMETMDGGWTVIQKRVDGSQSFNKNWAEYKNGFGSPEQDVWIGNDVINQLTKENDSSLYVTITLENGETKYELYDQFSVSDEAEKYKLFLAGNATGTLGDRMRNPGDPPLHLPGMYFSTPDRDNDHDAGSCAAGLKGGWWFNRCHQAFLNGLWASDDWAFPWYPIDKGTPIRKTVMMVKRR